MNDQINISRQPKIKVLMEHGKTICGEGMIFNGKYQKNIRIIMTPFIYILNNLCILIYPNKQIQS